MEKKVIARNETMKQYHKNRGEWLLNHQGYKLNLDVIPGGEVSLEGTKLEEIMGIVLKRGACFRFQAKGGSMYPFIKDGDVITIFPLSEAPPRLGDVVAFTHPESGKLTVHRLVRRKGDAYFLKGDNIQEADGVVRRKDILGCVKKVEREGRRTFFGLGPEKFLISLMIRKKILIPLLLPTRRFVRFIKRKLER